MFLGQLFNGIIIGSIYALVALGMTIIYSVLKLLQLAQGEILMVAAYILWQTLGWTNNNLPVAVLVTLLITVLICVVMERFAFRPLRERQSHHHEPFVVAIGLALLLTELSAKLFARGMPVRYPSVVTETATFPLFGTTISVAQVLVLLAALLAMWLLWFLLNHTKQGKALRAVAIDWSVARLLGVMVNRMAALAFALGAVLAVIGGVLFAMTFGYVNPEVGGAVGFKGLAVVLFAGLGSIPGAVVCGLFLGVVETMAVGYLASSWRDFFAFATIIAVLMFRPRGVFGTKY